MHRLLLSALALGALWSATPVAVPQAHAASYCLIGEVDQCTFTSFAQCLEAANGVAGWCVVDTDTPAPPAHSRRHS
jgi:hypothetical protein